MTPIEIICCIGWTLASAAACYLIIVCRSLKRSSGQQLYWCNQAVRFEEQAYRYKTALQLIVKGDYADGAEKAHPAVALARETLS